MNSTEQTLLILDNDINFRRMFDGFKEIIQQEVASGFCYNGKDLVVTLTNNSNGIPLHISYKEDLPHQRIFRNDLPMSLFNAGYRIHQFGFLFVSENNLSFSHGSQLYSAFKSKITGSIRKEVGYNEQKNHSIENAAIALLKRILKPEVMVS